MTNKFCFKCKYYVITVPKFCAQESSATNNHFKCSTTSVKFFKQGTLYSIVYTVTINAKKCKAGDIFTHSNLFKWTNVTLWQWTPFMKTSILFHPD